MELNEIWHSMQAAEETGRKLKVYAVEKNPNAVITLHVSSLHLLFIQSFLLYGN